MEKERDNVENKYILIYYLNLYCLKYLNISKIENLQLRLFTGWNNLESQSIVQLFSRKGSYTLAVITSNYRCALLIYSGKLQLDWFLHAENSL